MIMDADPSRIRRQGSGVGMFLQIKPGLRRMWRGPSTVQIGLDARRGLILDGLTDADVTVLNRLIHGVDSAALDVPTGGRPTGTSRPRSHQLVRLLAEADVLNRAGPARPVLPRSGRHRLADDAQIWSVVHPGDDDGWQLLARRDRFRVEIHGGGRIGTTLAATLAAAGVGSVGVVDASPVRRRNLAPAGPFPTDLGGSHRRAGRSATTRLVTEGRSSHPDDDPGREDRPSPPDLVVLVDHGAADARRADPFSTRDIPQLSIVVQEASALVGPLVLPGRSACLRCLDLHRTDLDDSWPLLLAQLIDRRDDRPGIPELHAEETASSGLVASLAALQVLHHLDGRVPAPQGTDGMSAPAPPASVGATLTVQLPDGLITRQPWSVHTECGCGWLPWPVAERGVAGSEVERAVHIAAGAGRMST
jgi:hypothetical protein